VAHMGKMGNAYKILVGRSEEKRPFGRPRHRWGIILNWILKERGCEDVVWIYLAQDSVQRRAAVNLHLP